METVAFFDLATRRSGWCVGTGEAVPAADFFEFARAPDDLGGLGLDLWKALDALHARTGFTVAAYERPILIINGHGRDGVRRTDKLADIRRLYGVGMILETWCAAKGIPCGEETVGAVKKEATRDANATKDQVAAQIEKIGVTLPLGPGRFDVADAVAGWLCGVRAWNPSVSREWDRRLFSARGALL